MVTLLAASPTAAQVDPEITNLSNDLATVRRDLEVTNARIMGIRDQQAVMQTRIADLVVHIEGVRADIIAKESEIQVLEEHRQSILDVVRGRAALLYAHREPVSPFDNLLLKSPMKLAAPPDARGRDRAARRRHA